MLYAHGRKQPAKTAAGGRTPDSFQGVASQYHSRIKPDCSDDLIYIDPCCLRDQIVFTA